MEFAPTHVGGCEDLPSPPLSSSLCRIRQFCNHLIILHFLHGRAGRRQRKETELFSDRLQGRISNRFLAGLNPNSEIETTDDTDEHGWKQPKRGKPRGRFFAAQSRRNPSHPCHPWFLFREAISEPAEKNEKRRKKSKLGICFLSFSSASFG